MSRYMIRFTKEGWIRFTSHLDLLRLFQRALKRSRIPLEYSKGFNPRPKIIFAHPLSLGFTSLGEYLEIRTTIDCDPCVLKHALNETTPEGIFVTDCVKVGEEAKSLASSVSLGLYYIVIPETSGNEIFWKAAQDYLERRDWRGKKRQKKSGEMIEIDMEPYVKNVVLRPAEKGDLTIELMLAAGSQANLNPEVFIHALLLDTGEENRGATIKIQRQDLFTENGTTLIKQNI